VQLRVDASDAAGTSSQRRVDVAHPSQQLHVGSLTGLLATVLGAHAASSRGAPAAAHHLLRGAQPQDPSASHAPPAVVDSLACVAALAESARVERLLASSGLAHPTPLGADATRADTPGSSDAGAPAAASLAALSLVCSAPPAQSPGMEREGMVVGEKLALQVWAMAPQPRPSVARRQKPSDVLYQQADAIMGTRLKKPRTQRQSQHRLSPRTATTCRPARHAHRA